MRVDPQRASGILLHPTCLPGPYGIGDLGPSAYRFLDSLASAGQSLWQVLPLGPTGFGDSPYSCFSSFAGNPLLVSLEILQEWGAILPEDLRNIPRFPATRVDFGAVIKWKMPLLRLAASRFLQSANGPPANGRPANGPRREQFEAFRREEAWWLEDYCVFIAVKQVFEGAWNRAWERQIALRVPAALARCTKERANDITVEAVIQFFFFSQWDSLHAAAAQKGIRVIGDLPIFAAPDSADVWAHRDLFLLDSDGQPTAVSGVPPDYFARTGQLWGNPLYNWDVLAKQGFQFWIQRIRAARRMFDFVRIDHFRGFDACWSVPAGAPTAEKGQWVKVPGARVFEAMERELGALPIIAEDLGLITPEVSALRERFGFPGMRILQFAFDTGEAGVLSADNRFLPHNHAPDSIVYTGTHDNDTTRGWYAARTAEERAYLDEYAPPGDTDIEWRLIRMALASVCRFAVIPLQDVRGLGTEARMNTPGASSENNWSWRMDGDGLDEKTARRLRALSVLYGRART